MDIFIVLIAIAVPFAFYCYRLSKGNTEPSRSQQSLEERHQDIIQRDLDALNLSETESGENVLYIVVRHPADSHERWQGNKWLDAYRLAGITTTPLVASQCLNAPIIYVHRCGCPRIGERPVIACSVKVDRIGGSEAEPIVYFREAQLVRKPVKRRLFGPTNSYYEEAP